MKTLLLFQIQYFGSADGFDTIEQETESSKDWN